ncbi:hypothetical protein KC342_g18946, partial [Hortaea werneckii]
MWNKQHFKTSLTQGVVDKKNPCRNARRNTRDFLHSPETVKQEDVARWENARVAGNAIKQDVDATRGHLKLMVAQRNFKFVTMLGFASTVMASWEVANGWWAIPLGFRVGWLSAIGWQVYLTGVCFMVGGLIQALISLNHGAYVPERWHQTLLTIAVVVSSVVFNTVLAVKLPLIEGILLTLHLCGAFAIVIPLWVMVPRTPVDVALFKYTNVGGWDTKGLAAMIGMVTPLNVLIGYDCTVHMAEELYDASITLPKAIMWSVAPNACLGILVILTLAFCSGNIEEVLQTRTGEPFVQIFYNATGSKAASSVM